MRSIKILTAVLATLVFSYFMGVAISDLPVIDVFSNAVISEPLNNIKTIKLSFIGDCTIGSDDGFSGYNTFMNEYEIHPPEWFFNNVAHIFNEDDYTIANLEGTFTTSEEKADKEFCFRAPPECAKVLSLGGVDVVSLANNHTYDYKEQGYLDTIGALDNENIGYFAYDITHLKLIDGVKIGFISHKAFYDGDDIRTAIEKNINSLRGEGAEIIVASFHWGDEGKYTIKDYQSSLAHFAIDKGVDLIIGHHPHVIGGIEEYNGKIIVYSLGNFCFGGNRNPADKDTFIFQQTFSLKNGEREEGNDINIIPCLISSIKERNNFQPTPAEGEDYMRIINKINEYSINFFWEDKLNVYM